MTPLKRAVGRLWRGRTTFANAYPYQEHLRKETLPGLTSLDGFLGAYVLRRPDAGNVEFVVLTLWTSQRAIAAFAPGDVERAVIPPAAAQLLAQWDDRATHYIVTLTADQR